MSKSDNFMKIKINSKMYLVLKPEPKTDKWRLAHNKRQMET